jgi:hypothetical protein
MSKSRRKQMQSWRSSGAKFWVRRVAHEVARELPMGEREAAERFVLRHRISILSAFHRRLKRSDVVAAMRAAWTIKS